MRFAHRMRFAGKMSNKIRRSHKCVIAHPAGKLHPAGNQTNKEQQGRSDNAVIGHLEALAEAQRKKKKAEPQHLTQQWRKQRPCKQRKVM